MPTAYLKGGPAHMIGPFTESYFASGGMGELGNRDGQHTVSMPVNCWNVPIEVMESRAPIVFEEKHLLEDSGGVGCKYRGGLGQRVRIRVLSDTPIEFHSRQRWASRPTPILGLKWSPGLAGYVGIDERRFARLPPVKSSRIRSFRDHPGWRRLSGPYRSGVPGCCA